MKYKTDTPVSILQIPLVESNVWTSSSINDDPNGFLAYRMFYDGTWNIADASWYVNMYQRPVLYLNNS